MCSYQATMTKSLPGSDHNAFFGYKNDYDIKNMPGELPSKKLSTTICLHQTTVPVELIAKLRNDHNMELTPSQSTSQSRSDTVVISGIPGNTGTGREEILQIVQKYAPRAVLLPQ